MKKLSCPKCKTENIVRTVYGYPNDEVSLPFQMILTLNTEVAAAIMECQIATVGVAAINGILNDEKTTNY